MKDAYSEDKLRIVVNAIHQAGGNSEEAARSTGIPVSTLRRWAKEANRRGVIHDPDVEVCTPKDLQQAARIAQLEEETRALRGELRAIQKDNLSTAKVRELISGLTESPPDPPPWITEEDTSGHAGVPITLWGDWHIGEVVKLDQTAGINEFNLSVARERVESLVDKIIKLCFDYTVNPDYPGLVVCLNGDLISGNIHDLKETNEAPVTRQVLECYSLILRALKTLAERFGRVHVTGTVGNHGRISDKPKSKNVVEENFEFLVLCMLEQALDDDPRFSFQISMDTDLILEVAGHRFLQTHGDATGSRGGDGIIGSAGPVIRGEKKVRDVQAMIDMPYETALINHYHNYLSVGESVMVCPSLKGYCEFAKNKLRARPERPAQLLFFVHPEWGVIREHRIWLAPKLNRRRKTHEFVAVPRGVE